MLDEENRAEGILDEGENVIFSYCSKDSDSLSIDSLGMLMVSVELSLSIKLLLKMVGGVGGTKILAGFCLDCFCCCCRSNCGNGDGSSWWSDGLGKEVFVLFEKTE